MKYLKLFENKALNAIIKNKDININYITKLIKISSKSDLNYQDSEGKSILSISAYYGRLDIIKELINAGVDLNIQDKMGKTALMLATFNGELKTVIELINAGADLNIQDNHDNTALHWCNNIDILKVLIKGGINVNVQDDDGNTKLIHSANEGELEFVEELINAGADLNIKNYDDDNDTALVFAAFQNNMEIINILLKNKNKIDISDYYFFDYLDDENQKNIIDNFPKIYKEYQILKKSEKYNLI